MNSTHTGNVFSGVRWTLFSRYASQTVQFVVALVLCSILAPEDYGVLAMAWATVTFVELLRNFGFAKSIIRHENPTEAFLNTVFHTNAVVALATTAGLFAASGWIGAAYDDPRVGQMVAALSLTVALSIMHVVPYSLLIREASFNRMAAVDVITTVINGTTAISLALTGFGMWALAGGTLLSESVRSVLYAWAHPWRPRLQFDRTELRGVFGFGANVSGFALLKFIAERADDALIGKFLGASSLGYYTFAYRFLKLPSQVLEAPIGRVLFPAMARMREEPARLSAAVLRGYGALAFVTFPMMFGLVAVAEPAVLATVGEKWLPAVPIMCILAPLGVLRVLMVLSEQIYLAMGRSDWMFRWGTVSTTAYIVSFFLGLPWGTIGVAWALCICYLVLAIPSVWIPFKLIEGLTVKRLLQHLRTYFLAALTMAGCVFLVRTLLAEIGLSPVAILTVSVLTGVTVYSGLMWWQHPAAVDDLVNMLPRPRSQSVPHVDQPVGKMQCTTTTSVG